MKGLRRLLIRFEDIMAASAFAEAGETDTAREIVRGTEKKERITKRVDRSYSQRVTVQKLK